MRAVIPFITSPILVRATSVVRNSVLNTNGNLLIRVIGAKVELFFCRHVEGTRRFLFHPWHGGSCAGSFGDRFNHALVTVVDGAHAEATNSSVSTRCSMGKTEECFQQTFTRWCSLNFLGDVSILTLLIMLHGSMRSLMLSVPIVSLILHMESGALLVVVMTCHIHVFQIIGLWDSRVLVPRESSDKIFLTTSFTDLHHRGCLRT